MLRVEITTGTPQRQRLLELEVEEGTTVDELIERSKILRYFPELNREVLTLGVWGKRVRGDRELFDGDRVELYRPLKIDPREVRRQLASLGRTMRDGVKAPD